MRLFILLSSCLLFSASCRLDINEVPDGWVQVSSLSELGCSISKDMGDMAAVPKCPAAKGLSGDNLLCVDFAQVQNLSSLSGWDFTCTGGASWTTMGGMLQVLNFMMFNKDCTATLPPINLSDPDKSKYKSLTLSLVHRIELSDPEQTAQIFLNNSSDQQRQMYFATGKKVPTRQTTTITLEKADLPTLINNTPQWVLKISSTATFSRAGWQIESIAVNASE